jgi:hypothetical protein
MNRLIAILMVATLSACAVPEETIGKDKEQAVRDFIAVRQLAEVDKVRTSNDDTWTELDPHFLIYETRRGDFLVEFSHACYDLSDNEVVADRRWDHNTMRARFDTIRGCRMAQIYALTEAEVAELEAIGESPGSRN